jgi:hypothetical protein
LDSFRYELGTFERRLAQDYIMVQGIKSAALPLSAGLLGLGLAAAGFLAYNKVDDLKDWVADQWEDGFGLVNDPAQTERQVTSYVSETRVLNPELAGMSSSEIYRLHYDMRDDLCQFFSRLWCAHLDQEFSGPNHARFLEEEWQYSKLGSQGYNGLPTHRFERTEVISVEGEDVNEISEYTYQMIIRETDSRNTQARITSGLLGAASTGIGAAFSEATHWALRSSGFMRGSDGWDGQNWEAAPGANRDILLMYAWARTDFQTGKWWSTVDSQGDVAFWLDVNDGGHGGTSTRAWNFNRTPYPNLHANGIADYEQIIWNAHQEMTSNSFGPFLQYLSQWPTPNSPQGWHWVFGEMYPPSLVDLDDSDDNGKSEMPDHDSEEYLDNIMPGEEDNPEHDPTKIEYWRSRNEQPPPGWKPS